MWTVSKVQKVSGFFEKEKEIPEADEAVITGEDLVSVWSVKIGVARTTSLSFVKLQTNLSQIHQRKPRF